MKKWQKTIGCILISLLIALNLVAILDYIILTEWTAFFVQRLNRQYL